LFLFARRLEDSASKRDWILLGALCGVAVLIEPVVMAVLPLLGICTLYCRYRRAHPWKAQLIVVALAGVATLLPWLVRNYMLFHKFIPVRSGYGLELYLGHNGYTEHWVNRTLHPKHSDAELSEYERFGEVAYMDHKMQQAKDYIRAIPHGSRG
jgi:4-amino-4-deoxy-L-arabinose transferase-like glycosyltransferase